MAGRIVLASGGACGIGAAVGTLVDEIRDCEGHLDGLVCNAGFMIRKPIGQLNLGEWRSVIATLLTSVFPLARVAEAPLRQSKGAIVTIASTRAHMSEPNTESYAAVKGEILALTHALMTRKMIYAE